MTLPSWYEHAACIGQPPEVFYFSSGNPAAYKEAKAICAGCRVRPDCLNFGLYNSFGFGVWGGQTKDERKLEMGRRSDDRRKDRRKAKRDAVKARAEQSEDTHGED